MGAKTGIEWTDSTWSPIRARVKADAAEIARAKGYTSLVQIAEKMAGHVGSHCEHVSPGCEHCYAETNNHRCLPANGTGLPYERRCRDLVEPFIDEKALLQPLKWKDAYDELRDGDGVLLDMIKRPRRIFVENQSDLFGKWVTDEMLDRVFAVMALCPQHIFQVLTKRPERMLAYFLRYQLLDVRGAFIGSHAPMIAPEKGPVYEWSGLPMPNVWLGVSVENYATADERIPLLLKTPAAVRFISAEPLLGPVDLSAGFRVRENVKQDALYGSEGLRWVIVGGESGPGSRPFHTDWAWDIVRQCEYANVPVFVKQLGAHVIQDGERRIKRDKKAGDMSEWPHEIRVRQFPKGV